MHTSDLGKPSGILCKFGIGVVLLLQYFPWHIINLKVYDQPKPITDLTKQLGAYIQIQINK
jgi:hypothetical protein